VSVPGAVVSIADKLDTITGCFGVGLIPTGAQDPYARRRQALGIIAIIREKKFTLSLDDMVEKSALLLAHRLTRDRETVVADVLEFFKDRLRHSLLSQGLSFDSIDAVLSAPWFDLVDAVKRIRAIESFKQHPACESLVVAFKRVSNILKGFDRAAAGAIATPDPAGFSDPQEAGLLKARDAVAPVIDAHARPANMKRPSRLSPR